MTKEQLVERLIMQILAEKKEEFRKVHEDVGFIEPQWVMNEVTSIIDDLTTHGLTNEIIECFINRVVDGTCNFADIDNVLDEVEASCNAM